MERYYCTYFDRNYLVKALALIESLNKHEKNEFTLFAVCMDEITRVILKKLNPLNVVPIPMHEIEQRDFPLLETKKNRSTVEYYWTATPTIILRLLERNPHIDVLTYLDADLYFYSSPNPIFEELGNQSVLIHEHRFSPDLNYLEMNGKYNVGLLCFRNDSIGIEVLNWWRDKCIEWCYNRLENGKFADQLYLNDWPERFKGVAILQNIGAGVAPWNHVQYSYNIDKSGNLIVNDTPFIFYHFHSLTFANPEIVIPVKHAHYPLTEEILRLIFLPYLYALSRGITTVKSILPDFIFGLFEKDVLTNAHTFFAKKEVASTISKSDISHSRISLDEEWDCFCSSRMLGIKGFGDMPKITERDQEQHIYAQIVDKIKRINSLLESRRFDEAYAALKQSIEKYPDSPDLLNLQAIIKAHTGDKEGAKSILLDLSKRWPAYFPAYNNLALIFWNFRDFENAMKYFEEALKISNYDRAAVMAYGEMLMSIKKFAKAKELYEAYLKTNPNNSEIHSLLQKAEGVLEKVNKLSQVVGKIK